MEKTRHREESRRWKDEWIDLRKINCGEIKY